MDYLGDIARSLFVASFLAIVANRLVAGLVTPLFERYKWDRFPLLYVAWTIAGLLVWLSGVNLFERIIPSPIVGGILTAIVAGGGANLLHDLFDGAQPEIIAFSVGGKN